jgi:hypothetical protein
MNNNAQRKLWYTNTALRQAAMLIATLAVLLASGCAVSRSTTTMLELIEMRGVGPLRALTVDSRLITFEEFTFNDSLLLGSGTMRYAGKSSAFAGSVRFDSIAFLERKERSELQGAWVVPMAVIVGAGLMTILSEPHFSIHHDQNSSCPYVYSFDGEEYKLDAEVFGTSVSKAMEAKTFSILPSLIATGGSARIRVSNERPETHMVNSVQLFAAEAGDAGASVLDTENTLWPLPRPVPPVAASDHSGADILGDLNTRDGGYWISDLAGCTAKTGFRDRLELEFTMASDETEATLVVDAINTELIFEVYRSIGGLLGDATLEFYEALEKDPELQRYVRDWVTDCGLSVEVHDGTDWRSIGVMPPEANTAPFTRAIRIPLPRTASRKLRVRLSTLTDVWRIDAVAIDESPAVPIPMHELRMTAAVGSRGDDMQQQVQLADSSYAIVLPPNHIDMQFDASPVAGMHKPVFIVAAQGYLYEWFPTRDDDAPPSVTDALTGSERIALLKSILQHQEVFLPPIYGEWRKDRELTISD